LRISCASTCCSIRINTDNLIPLCDLALESIKTSAELYAYADGEGQDSNAFSRVADYLRALELEPGTPLHSRLGWSYLVSGALQIALENFNMAIDIELRMLMPSAVAAWRSPVLTSTKKPSSMPSGR